jgi:hypothetical protein
MLLKEKEKEQEDEEKGVTSHWMTLKKREDTVI